MAGRGSDQCPPRLPQRRTQRLHGPDSLAGKETYGAGRYLEPQALLGGKVLVDFNYAYNPYCAYNPKYSCAIPTRENHLEIAVEAGEKKYHD